MIDITMKRNPTGRMTTPQDVANAITALSRDGTEFINGDIISVDGGEFVTGSLGGWPAGSSSSDPSTSTSSSRSSVCRPPGGP